MQFKFIIPAEVLNLVFVGWLAGPGYFQGSLALASAMLVMINRNSLSLR